MHYYYMEEYMNTSSKSRETRSTSSNSRPARTTSGKDIVKQQGAKMMLVDLLGEEILLNIDYDRKESVLRNVTKAVFHNLLGSEMHTISKMSEDSYDEWVRIYKNFTDKHTFDRTGEIIMEYTKGDMGKLDLTTEESISLNTFMIEMAHSLATPTGKVFSEESIDKLEKTLEYYHYIKLMENDMKSLSRRVEKMDYLERHDLTYGIYLYWKEHVKMLDKTLTDKEL